MAAALSVNQVSFQYGQTQALRGVSFSVERGEVFGLLGPNGGGKTTLFRILATLLTPASGSAHVCGYECATNMLAVRRCLGVVFQNQSLDQRLTAEENLIHHGHLYGLRGADLRRRVREALDRLGLSGKQKETVGTLSGGQRRRVELAKALLHSPTVLLLDEASTGVDPAARLEFWDYLQTLRREEGVTVLLTTHLLEEADKCDRLAILDQGQIVAQGTPAELKRAIGGDVVTLVSPAPEILRQNLDRAFSLEATVIDHTLRFEHEKGGELAAKAMKAFPAQIESVTVAHPTLEDVFIHETGHRLADSEGPPEG